MHRTLAVSYRWMEDRQICLIEDVTISMSDFEMQTVVEAIRTTNCRYVWIDKIAVPQVKSGLQNKLLSRMLAVYRCVHAMGMSRMMCRIIGKMSCHITPGFFVYGYVITSC